jgi:hypothetical protein
MEDKWFIYHDSGWVYFHRSWTGFCIYKLRFEQVGDQFVVREAWVTRDREQYTNDDIVWDQWFIRSQLFHRFDIGSEPSEPQRRLT